MLSKLTGDTQGRLLNLLRRAPKTITELSQALSLTDNAVRTHIAALSRDGLVEQVGTKRDTGGKPARQYGLTEVGGELFPKAYAAALSGLVEEIVRTEGWERAVTLLQGVGTRAAAGVAAPNDLNGRVEVAATTLRALGADLDVIRDGPRWELKGYACPLSAVTAGHPQVCALVTALVAEITGRPVTECCERGDRPRCRFTLSESRAESLELRV
ncbi:MAG: ArsR family transcriptional regulator [Gemmatimonadota bacterium]